MSSIRRPLGGRALRFRLDENHLTDLIDGNLLATAGRSARTLVKEGPLRVTLVALGPGGSLASHRAGGPLTVHVLSGAVRFRSAGDEWELTAGDLLSLEAGAEHAAESEAGGVLLLTIALGSTN